MRPLVASLFASALLLVSVARAAGAQTEYSARAIAALFAAAERNDIAALDTLYAGDQANQTSVIAADAPPAMLNLAVFVVRMWRDVVIPESSSTRPAASRMAAQGT